MSILSQEANNHLNFVIVNTDKLHCHYFESDICRSCSELGVSIEASRAAKVAELLASISSHLTSNTEIQQICGNHPFGSRTRCKMAVGGSCEAPTVGFVESTQNITDISKCPLHSRLISEVLTFAKQLITDFKLTPYDIKQRKGELKYILLHCNGNDSEASLRFVLRSSEAIGRIEKAIPTIHQRFPEIKVISVNLQPLPAAIIEGTDERILSPHVDIWDTFGKTQICFTPQSFSQVNHQIANELYQSAARLVATLKPSGVFDLYCGVGCFSFFVAPFCDWCTGIELSSSAITAANKTKERNNITNLHFKAEDTAAFLAAYQSTLPDLIIVNPPRRGLGEALCEQIKALNPKWILYSSCNPKTLVADLDLLCASYNLTFLQPFDMFPLTKHLETLIMLERK